MENVTLDQWKTIPNHEVKKPLVIDNAVADSFYEDSYERYIERLYDWQIEQKLVEEKTENLKEMETHSNYVKNNYIRIGGN